MFIVTILVLFIKVVFDNVARHYINSVLAKTCSYCLMVVCTMLTICSVFIVCNITLCTVEDSYLYVKEDYYESRLERYKGNETNISSDESVVNNIAKANVEDIMLKRKDLKEYRLDLEKMFDFGLSSTALTDMQSSTTTRIIYWVLGAVGVIIGVFSFVLGVVLVYGNQVQTLRKKKQYSVY